MPFLSLDLSRNKSVFISFFILSIISCVMVLLRVLSQGSTNYVFLVWNLFLAWIPLIISMIIYSIHTRPYRERKTLKIMVLGFFWLLFYPNAPYMITDFIHLTYMNFISFGERWTLNNDLWLWYDFVMFSLFVWIGTLLGFLSLYIIHRLIGSVWSQGLAWVFVLFISFLSSFGIYLGRFIRWNSWDIILRPFQLFQSLIDNLHMTSLIFSLLFGLFLALVYWALYQLTLVNKEKYPF